MIKVMSYSDFCKEYARTIKKYPGISQAWGYCDTLKVKNIHYVKRGGKWIETETNTHDLPYQYYVNIIDAIPFFRNIGGFERVSMGYTYAGYVPVQLDSISPDRTEKHTRIFIFEK